MENKKILDYQEFYDELIEKDYIPDKVDYQWTDSNEDFMRESLFLFYAVYTKVKQPELLNAFLKLYGEVISVSHSHFPEEDGYL